MTWSNKSHQPIVLLLLCMDQQNDSPVIDRNKN